MSAPQPSPAELPSDWSRRSLWPTLATPLWPAAKPTTESSVVWIWSSSCPQRGVYAFGQGRLPSASVSIPQGKTALWAEDGVVDEIRGCRRVDRTGQTDLDRTTGQNSLARSMRLQYTDSPRRDLSCNCDCSRFSAFWCSWDPPERPHNTVQQFDPTRKPVRAGRGLDRPHPGIPKPWGLSQLRGALHSKHYC